MINEQTLILLKPDTIQRNLVGKILDRFTMSGLKIKAMKMLQASEEDAKNHYKLDEEWAMSVYQKSLASAKKEGRPFEYRDHMHIGETIQSWNMKFLMEGPIIALVIEGENAIEVVRKIAGSTEPSSAEKGTIRNDFAPTESYALADSEKRVLRNLMHASDSTETANYEISLWFDEKELIN